MVYDYDIICIGMGPAGMAVSAMGAEMGLKVWAIEKHRLGGECMNVGCIPSKSLLRTARARHVFTQLEKRGLARAPKPDVVDPFRRIGDAIEFINDRKTMGMFKKEVTVRNMAHLPRPARCSSSGLLRSRTSAWRPIP